MNDNKYESDGIDEIDGMWFYDHSKPAFLTPTPWEAASLDTNPKRKLSEVVRKSSVPELWIRGYRELGASASKSRIFRVFDYTAPTTPSEWPIVDVWLSDTLGNVTCFILKWICLVYDGRDAFRMTLTLAINDRNEALSIKDSIPTSIKWEGIYGHYADDERVIVSFGGHRVVRVGVETGTLRIDDPTPAEQARMISTRSNEPKAKVDNALFHSAEASTTPPKEDAPTKAPELETTCDVMTIQEAAKYARVSERTIRNWLKACDDGGKPMLPGHTRYGNRIRIPKADLTPYRKKQRQTRTPKKKPASKK